MKDGKFSVKPKLSLDDADFKRAFVEDHLVIDCAEIRLVQKGSKSPRSYSAPGFIQVGAQNGVEVRVVCPRPPSDPYDPLAFFKRDSSFTSGVLVPQDHYFSLEARDIAGNLWTCASGSLDKDDREDSFVLTFSSQHLRMEAPSDARRSYAHLVFLDDLEFPKNAVQSVTIDKGGKRQSLSTSRDCSEGDVAGMHISYAPKNSRPDEMCSTFVAIADEGVEPPLGFEDRLIEAMRFCTATMATPVMSEVSANGVKFIDLSKARSLNKGIVQAPISHYGFDKDFYKLFECYFIYACENAKGKDYAPLSAKVGGLFALKGVWIDTVVLLLCVAVESLLGEEQFKSFGKPKQGLLDDLKKLVELVQQAPVGEGLVKRVLGAINGMKSQSAADRLHALIEAGVLAEDDRKTWKKYRNTSAHGSFEIDPEEFQQVLDAAYRLMAIIYKLVFMRIGYSGVHSNFASRGWRVDQFDSLAYQAALDAKVRGEVTHVVDSLAPEADVGTPPIR